MKTYMITGASKGLGEAVSVQCFQEGNHCILVARSTNVALIERAKLQGAQVTSISADLSIMEQLPAVIERVFSEIGNSDELYLINNAGVVEPIKPAGQLEQGKLELSMKLNYLAPVILTNSFIDKTKDFTGKKTVVNISSGAALRPIHGWSAYCSTKAGLEMFTRVAGLEQQKEENPVKIISFSPGIMDTGMQANIRMADEKDFADAELFQSYKDKGTLRSPQLVAEKLFRLLEGDQLENGKFYDIKELI
ncbi:(S)-benzoin forming benzil reductase [Peribacillus cavernae]|uniref:(S)-benzoin forming benzil reductase n=1 Tax=Peribacillus cavernae TaxID=1674310 RepID=A0A433HIZ9_9BACI|nr:(S)-benzoin forming benzil reductase [Peribacillus cavernae]MDQ0217775.1 sepiapterin reductase [Peribacillus cavernae]RUQ28229.1 (S)-benzoin forming benzil reductase [Peribacillus cavernae]